jgi:hypothetical protein
LGIKCFNANPKNPLLKPETLKGWQKSALTQTHRRTLIVARIASGALGGFRRFDKMPVGNASILMGDLEPKPFQAFEVFGDRL